MKTACRILSGLAVASCTLSAQPTHTFTGRVDTTWVRYYGLGHTPANSEARAMVVDASGNVYVTGRDYMTIKCDSDGDTVWVRHHHESEEGTSEASAIAVDATGCVYVTGWGESGYDTYFLTLKYTSTGDTAWVRRYRGLADGGYDDWATALAVDGNGNVYVTGGSDYWGGSTTMGDTLRWCSYATIKYTSAGDTAWVRRYDGSGDGSESASSVDYASAIAVDSDGNVYVTGRSKGTNTSFDYATIKYTSAGDAAWINRFNGPGNRDDIATALAVDASGNLYVTGSVSNGIRGGSSYATIKYTSAGDTAWIRRFVHYWYTSSSHDYPTALAVDAIGNAYVTGSTEAGDYATVAYTSAGEMVWAMRYAPSGYGHGTALAIDAGGNVYVTGWSDNEDWLLGPSSETIKYDSAGREVWVARASDGIPIGIHVDASGRVYVAGTSTIGNESTYTIVTYVQTPTTIADADASVARTFALYQNYPNPFNPSTTIRYELPYRSHVRLTVYDLLGRQVAALVNEELDAGTNQKEWKAAVSTGMYFYRLEAVSVGDFSKSGSTSSPRRFVDVKKMVLLR